ncbi:MAG: YkgJ family cysteine cluster protein [Planctomycetaceae bacterium]
MKPWFGEGLKFGCTRCGDCCTGAPGNVWLAPGEERVLAARLGLGFERFRADYTRAVGERRSLRERENGDCILLSEERRCTVHDGKPRQCLAYPFWPRLVASREAWEAESRKCPGMDTGPRYAADEIEAIADPATPRAQLEALVRRPRA